MNPFKAGDFVCFRETEVEPHLVPQRQRKEVFEREHNTKIFIVTGISNSGLIFVNNDHRGQSPKRLTLVNPNLKNQRLLKKKEGQ